MLKKTVTVNGPGRARARQPVPADSGLLHEVQSALGPMIEALRRLARSKMEPALARRMQELGERKEFLSKREQQELHRLVAFWRQRTIDKLQAKVALKELGRILPKTRKVS